MMKKILYLTLLLSMCVGVANTDAQQKNDKPQLKMNGPAGIENIQPSATASVSPELRLLDPALRNLLRQVEHISLTDGERADFRGSPGLQLSYKNSTIPHVDILIRIEEGVLPEAMLTPGMQIRTQAGNILAVRLPVADLRPLAEKEGLLGVEASRISYPLHNASRGFANVDAVHNGEGLERAYRGAGVVVGVIDTGIDFTHPDFSNDNGTRIQYLLEYLDTDKHANDSAEWSKNDIDNDPSSVTQTDGDGGGGHGTHVAGSAAGGGKGNNTMTGMAPDADLIFVNGIRDDNGNGGFSDTDVIGGVSYIFEKAEEMGKPAVVNLSLGGNFGSLDGRSAYEQALSNLSGPGKIIVAAAGNEGFDVIHAGHELELGKSYAILVWPSHDEYFYANGWYDSGAIQRFAISVYSYDDDGLSLESTTDWVNAGSWDQDMELTVDGSVVAEAAIDAETIAHTSNGDANVYFQVESANDAEIDDYFFALVYESALVGRADFWTFESEFINYDVGFTDVTQILGDTHMTVGVPAAADKVIAVGSFTTKNQWKSGDGNTYNWQNPSEDRDGTAVIPEAGSVSFFSSRGPRRDGRTAPDISAPGELIFSSKSGHLTAGEGFDPAMVLEGGSYLGMQGTSMASPHLAGIVALMLEANPDLDYDAIISIFEETAVSDSHTGTVPNNNFGYGKVDALAAVQKAADYEGTSAEMGRDLPEMITLHQNYPNPFNPTTQISYELSSSADVRLAVYDVLGRKVALLVNESQAAGSHQMQFDASGLSSGVYMYLLETPDTRLSRKMLLIK